MTKEQRLKLDKLRQEYKQAKDADLIARGEQGAALQRVLHTGDTLEKARTSYMEFSLEV